MKKKTMASQVRIKSDGKITWQLSVHLVQDIVIDIHETIDTCENKSMAHTMIIPSVGSERWLSKMANRKMRICVVGMKLIPLLVCMSYPRKSASTTARFVSISDHLSHSLLPLWWYLMISKHKQEWVPNVSQAWLSPRSVHLAFA